MFSLLLIAQAFSLTGGYIQTLVLSWVAASLGGGLYSLAAYMIACYLPVAVLSYPFGRWLAKQNQKPWLLLSECTLAALSLLLWAAAKWEFLTFPFLLIFGAGWGVVRAVQTPIYQSLPRRLAKELSKGTALLTVVTYGARGLGPILGGLLYAKFGAPIPFFINFCSFIPSVGLLCFLRLPRPKSGEKAAIKPYLPHLIEIFLLSFFGVNYNVTFVALVKDAGQGSASYGIALGLLGLGALLGFWLKSKTKRAPPIPLLMGGMGLIHLILALLPNLWVCGLCILLYGGLDFWYFSTAAFRLSKAAPKEQVTAVMGLYTVVTVGAMPVGALFWSFAAKRFGLSAALCAIGIGLILLASIKLLYRNGAIHETSFRDL